jgi:protein phosphatase
MRSASDEVAPAARGGSDRLAPRVTAALLSDAGPVRQANEDCGRLVMTARPDSTDVEGVLAVVADGMGGHQAGAVASRLAVEVLCRLFRGDATNAGDSLREAAIEANHAIYALASEHPELQGMGTTCTALVIRPEGAYLAHVGDSRVYLLRDGGLYQMTEDHTAVMDLVRGGMLTLDEARRHPERNVLSRAVGRSETAAPDVWSEPFPICIGDRFVICSDGLTDAVTETCVREVVAALEPSAACQALIDEASSRNAQDNVTVAVIAIEPAVPAAGRIPETREAEVAR